MTALGLGPAPDARELLDFTIISAKSKRSDRFISNIDYLAQTRRLSGTTPITG
jgi:hypothetical protein